MLRHQHEPRAPFDYECVLHLNMAEREALQREIEQLQNLIKDHKRVHGDAPSSSAPWSSPKRGLARGRGHNPRYLYSYTGEPQPHASHPTSHWRKTYSLNNKTTRDPGGGASQPYPHKTQHISSATSVAGSLVCSTKLGVERMTEAKVVKASAAPLESITGKESLGSDNNVPAISTNRTVLKPTRTKTEIGIKPNVDLGQSSSLTNSRQSEPERNTSLNATLKASDVICNTATSFDPLSEETRAFNAKKTLAQLQATPQFTSNISSNRTVLMAAASKDFSSGQTVPPKACSGTALNLKLKSDSAVQVPTASSPHKRSQFTWVKSQGAKSSQPSPTSASVSTASSMAASIKQVHGSNKKVHRRPSLSIGAVRTSRYSWVSASCSTTKAAKGTITSKLPNKQLSPKASNAPGKSTKDGQDGVKKLTCSPSPTSKRTKVSGSTSTPQVSHANRYCWKAATQNSSAASSGSTPRSSRKGSLYRWTAQKEGKDSGLGSHPFQAPQNPSTVHLSSSGFKLRSRTKIIRRHSSSSPAPERKPGLCVVTLRSRYSLRRRTHTSVRSPVCARRGQPRALVSIGRHKLRRLSASTPTTVAWTPRAGFSSPSVRNPASLRVIKTRYKIDTRRAQLQHHNPALSYRVRRIQSARNLLQSRLRTPLDRQWRDRGMRWIGGALYRVSANKLSRTHTTSISSVRSGKWHSSHEVSSSPSGVVRTSSVRHVASRAVQRSLAIIRQARQKKQQARQYCMYYNRFGKCNRGTACPYIHDPDKVAVCTRFLRGTCKKTDGTCPFSHKVSKEKMPVCSYFLKGICNNSSCPYSHVYVSRKAAVCQDFIRGYCPQGEKCKKKHTLVCPEFSSTGVCPKGSKCKLQHRQRVKRTGSSLSSAPAKKAHTRDYMKSSEPSSTQADEGTPSSGLSKLPSFISLSSSPDTPEAIDSPQCSAVAGVEATGKKLHIKPRF